MGTKFWTISSGAVVRKQNRKIHCLYSWRKKYSGCQWRVEAIAGDLGSAISSTNCKDTENVVNIKKKTTMFNWHNNTSNNLRKLHLWIDQESKKWQSISCVLSAISTVNISSDHFLSASVTPMHRKVGAPEGKSEIVTIERVNQKQTYVIFSWFYFSCNCWYFKFVILVISFQSQKRFLC